MNIPISGHSTIFSSVLSLDFDESSIQLEIHRQQYGQRRKAFKAFKETHLVSGKSVSLEDVGRILTVRDGSYVIEHIKTSICEQLHVCMDGIQIELDKPLFPKRKNPQIAINIPSIAIREHIGSSYTADSIADFLIAVKEWVPEYMAIEENVMIQEKQRQMACKIAFDLMKRTIEPVLDRKNYHYNLIGPDYNNKANIRITSNEIISINIDVDLLEDFLEKLVAVLESLPELS